MYRSTSLTSRRNSRDNDDAEISIWNAERTPLLKRTEDDAQFMGARRHISGALHSQISASSFQSILDQDDPKLSWRWQRKVKVGILTLLCLFMVVALLFLPEEMESTRILNISKYKSERFDLDKTYHKKGNRHTLVNSVLFHFPVPIFFRADEREDPLRDAERLLCLRG